MNRYYCIINRSHAEAVCCIPWNKSLKELERALEEPQLYFNSRVVLLLNHWINYNDKVTRGEFEKGKEGRELTIAEFTDEPAYKRGKKLLEKGEHLGKLQGLLKQPGTKAGEITPEVIKAVKYDREHNKYSQRKIAYINKISLGSVHNILSGKHDEKVA
ncbi:MAG: hypothetical protein OEU36_20760 [Gammaproteobacteria bacterium]|nr:hypothetical protein [Gammaproteobacteria bacterium]